VSGVLLCKLNELSSAERVISGTCHSCTHVNLHLAALDQLGDCLAAQVVLLCPNCNYHIATCICSTGL